MSKAERRRARREKEALGGIPFKRVSRAEIDKGAGIPGLWSHDNSFFANSRRLRTVDPTPREIQLGYLESNSPAWCARIETTYDGRLIV